MIAVQSLCQVSIPVQPADATVTISFLPTYGNCGGLETPENSFVDPLGFVIVQCDTACAFTLSAAGGSVFLDQATTDCNFNIDGLPVPVYLPGEPDCHADCVCEQDGDNEQTFNLLYDPSSDFVPNTCGTPTMCAPLLPDYRCALGLGPSIVDTPTCGIDVDAQVLTTCSECSTGLPSPTNLYSVFLSLGDLNVGAYCTDIEGRAAVAGDANWCSAIGSQIAGPNTNNIPCMELIDYLCDYQWAFVVGGTANIDGAVYGGDAWASVYQTSNLGRVKNQTQEKTKPKINSLAQKLAGRSDAKDLEARINKQQKIEKPEAVDYQCLTFAPPTPVPIDFSAMEAKLKQYQFILNSQAPTGQVSFTGPTITFRGSNTVDTEVFAVNCASIGTATTGMKVENINPAVKAIIVNVFCYPNNWTIDSSNGFGMQAWEPFQNRLIWVVDSDGVNIASIGFRGTLLAPWAHVNANNGNIWGQLLAHSFTGSYQFNLPLWAGCPSIVYPPADKKDPKIRAPPPHRTIAANKA